ncbi:UNKNOWN [Stylonychia lemnae]|uniref:Uncharacterized protein n=1 Tax=Stylonychia lemnae TaxID=5949 RepID=A0A077ZTC3_STYLE|nr:UNKNOWN [Stylonychia lemnae]|eukprot:CDW73143.1 UNKNOWN [Stylonychia lemnae]
MRQLQNLIQENGLVTSNQQASTADMATTEAPISIKAAAPPPPETTKPPVTTTSTTTQPVFCKTYFDINPNPSNTSWEGNYCKVCNNQTHVRVFLTDRITCAPAIKQQGICQLNGRYNTQGQTFALYQVQHSQEEICYRCTTCAKGFSKQIVRYEYGPFFLRKCVKGQPSPLLDQLLWHQTLIKIGDNVEIKACDRNYYRGSIKDSSLKSQSICLYNKCGINGFGPDYSEPSTLCRGTEITPGSKQQKALYINNGTHIHAPFLFVQQALSQINKEAPQYQKYNATIWLMKGDHFFFYCNGVTKFDPQQPVQLEFCNPESMQNSYIKSNNVYLNVRALSCEKLSSIGYTFVGGGELKEYCIFLNGFEEFPKLYINSNMFYFNITRYAYFENVFFDGSNQYGQVLINVITPNGVTNQIKIENEKLSIIPFKKCDVNEDSSNSQNRISFSENQKQILVKGLKVNLTCVNNEQDKLVSQPNTSSDACTAFTTIDSQTQCSGEPYSEDFYQYDEQQTGMPFLRRKVLFNIYSFDRANSNEMSSPQLILSGCTFQYFVNNYEALVYVENNNYYSEGQRKGESFVFLGEDRGISYEDYQYSEAQIIISDSEFTYLNWISNTTGMAQYFANEGYNQRMNTNNKISVPNFYHKGIILNIEDFQGPVEFSGCKFVKNMIYIPEIYFQPHYVSQKNSIQTFQSREEFIYRFKICDSDTNKAKYFMDTGFDYNSNLDSMFNDFERLSVIYISRNQGNIIFHNNKFTDNIGMYGGAITINSPNFKNGKNSFVIINKNIFYYNMAYVSGNSIYIRTTKILQNFNEQCGGIYMNDNYFFRNIGMKKHNGGTQKSIILVKQMQPSKISLILTYITLSIQILQRFKIVYLKKIYQEGKDQQFIPDT